MATFEGQVVAVTSVAVATSAVIIVDKGPDTVDWHCQEDPPHVLWQIVVPMVVHPTVVAWRALSDESDCNPSDSDAP